MGTALATIQPEELDTMQRTASLLVASGYFDARGPKEIQIAQLATKILAGRELGYAPYTAVQGIHIIQGKPQISANLMAAAVKAHPRYDYRVRKMADAEVAIEFFENGESIGISTFTAEDAKRAGTQNLQKFPRNMLFARALSNGVRWFCPDVFYGNSVYVEGEIGEMQMEQPAYIVVDRESGEVLESPTTSEPEAPIPPVDDDNPFADAPPAQNGNGAKAAKLPTATLKRLHAVGNEAYGKEWNTKRPELVKSVTKGRSESSSDLTPDEASTLISGMEKRIAKLAAESQAVPA